MELTPYGKKMIGSTPLIIIAPHAAGDDLKTGIVATKLARALGAFVIINNQYYKPTNKKALLSPEHVSDFNKLTWSFKKEKYLWARKHPQMKQFFEDIKKFTELARNFSPDQKVLSIHIHAMNLHTGIDIGAGVKFHPRFKKFQTSATKKSGPNSGSITLELSMLQKFRSALQNTFLPQKADITIGKNFPGWSKFSAVQWHKYNNHNDEAFHLEIGKELRLSQEKRNELIASLTTAIQNTFFPSFILNTDLCSSTSLSTETETVSVKQ